MKIMITGAAGFIGSSLAIRLLQRGDVVYGIDNLNDYYDVNLKKSRLIRLQKFNLFTHHQLDICDQDAIKNLFLAYQFDIVVNLAAQAGVRYSIDNPSAYVNANLVGFGHILEGCRQSGVGHLVYASSSSVYGANTKMPFNESDCVDHPISLYAASKKANELMAHCYAHLYRLPCTGLRFFTVYGPWGRPDMALFKFTKGIIAGNPIDVYNQGNMVRDFTYIDDIVEGVMHVLDHPAEPNRDWDSMSPDPASSHAPYRIYNIGNSCPVQLMHYIEVLEQCLGKKAILNMLPMQEGDVQATNADVSKLQQDFDYQPETIIEIGVANFVKWYLSYYG